MGKAVCQVHHVAHDRATGCGDCLALERERAQAHMRACSGCERCGIGTDDTLVCYTPKGYVPDVDGADVLANLKKLVDTLPKVPPCPHVLDMMSMRCVVCQKSAMEMLSAKYLPRLDPFSLEPLDGDEPKLRWKL